jgi:hypothetical protein
VFPQGITQHACSFGRVGHRMLSDPLRGGLNGQPLTMICGNTRAVPFCDTILLEGVL